MYINLSYRKGVKIMKLFIKAVESENLNSLGVWIVGGPLAAFGILLLT